jgi:thiamine biosynthesis protein ThiS
MKVVINGESKEVAEDILLTNLLKEQGFNPDLVVVELNQEIVPKTEFDGVTVPNGGELEILSFVGGG